MKTRILKFMSAALLFLAFVSCGAVKKAGEYTPSKSYELGSTKWINGQVFQTINNHQALVEIKTSSYDRPLIFIVTPNNSKEYFFDNLDIRGQYVFIGTHRYKTVNRDFDQYKTVPVFIEKKYYKDGMEWDDWYERITEPETTNI